MFVKYHSHFQFHKREKIINCWHGEVKRMYTSTQTIQTDISNKLQSSHFAVLDFMDNEAHYCYIQNNGLSLFKFFVHPSVLW